MDDLLQVNHVGVTFGTSQRVKIIEDLCFSIKKGSTLGIVGESGSGKSVTSLAIMGLLPEKEAHVSGEILLEGKNLLSLSERQMQAVRGKDISMVFQEPMTSLNPLHTCGKQIMESMQLHQADMKKEEAKKRALHYLSLCGIPDPERRFGEYPHQLSGGMRQRVMIAMALSCSPKLLIADEPTTALDVTIQAQILDLLHKLKESGERSILLITHDLGVVAGNCDFVNIMYMGQIVESAPVQGIFEDPWHPYTRGLLKAIPTLEKRTGQLTAIKGSAPDAKEMPAGCRFHPRCPMATEKCRKEVPPLLDMENQRAVRCFYPGPEGGQNG